ncbi:hypothetical protein Droror1_Dr00025768 [Drosera rotundifolia]
MGFGYDSVDDDYKVVKVRQSGMVVDIYSLGSDRWRRSEIASLICPSIFRNVAPLKGQGDVPSDGICFDVLGNDCFGLPCSYKLKWFKIWIMTRTMENRRSKEALMRLLRVERKDMLPMLKKQSYPVAYFKGKNTVLMSIDNKGLLELFCSDLHKKHACTEVLRVHDEQPYFPVVWDVESLVSPTSFSSSTSSQTP